MSKSKDPLIEGALKGYELKEVLGMGGTSKVYLAVKDDRKYAIKIPIELESIKLEETIDTRLLKSRKIFLNEAKKWKQLTDKVPDAIVNLIDYNEFPFPWIAMEYADSDFRHAIDDGTATISDIIDLLDRLESIHRAGVFHLDIKPQNILRVGHDWKYTDFGYSRYSNAITQNYTRGFFGTCAYTAPEQFDPSLGKLDERTDLWQIGIVALEVITRKPPFSTESFGVVMNKILHGEIDTKGVPKQYAPIFKKVFSVEKNERYESAAAFADDLRTANTPVPKTPQEMYETGLKYYFGIGVTEQTDFGLDLLRKSAKKRYAPATQFLNIIGDSQVEKYHKNELNNKEKPKKQDNTNNKKTAPKEALSRLLFATGMIIIVIGIILQPFNWMPATIMNISNDILRAISYIGFLSVFLAIPTIYYYYALRSEDPDFPFFLAFFGFIIHGILLIAATLQGNTLSYPASICAIIGMIITYYTAPKNKLPASD